MAYAEAMQRPLLAVAAEVARGAPEQLLLAVLQAEFRTLIESFLNHHDWGLDGGPVRFARDYPRARFPIATMRILTEALEYAGEPQIAPLHEALRRCDVPGDEVPVEAVAGLLAAFYSALPGLAQGRATRLVTVVPPSALDLAAYVATDPSYRAPVVQFAGIVQKKLAWAFRFVLLHGSLATEDYLPGISDFDTFAILRDEVASSAAMLLTLRDELLALYPCFYRIDPQQHHGLLLCAGQDTLFYPQAFFPFTLFKHGRTVLGDGEPLRFAERDDTYERAHTLYAVRQNYRWLAAQDWEPPSQFEAKLQIQRLLLAPTFFLQRSGTYLYKRESFPRIREILPPSDLRCLDQAEEVRKRDLYGIPLSWSDLPAGDLSTRVQAFHRVVRSVPLSSSLREQLGPHFWREASCFVDLLCSGGADADHLSHAAEDFAWHDEPTPIPESAYSDARRATRAELKAIDEKMDLWEFGNVSQPGISDLDLLIEVPDHPTVPDGLKAFTTAGPDGVFRHPPSMILRQSDLQDAGKLYPIFDAHRCAADGTADRHVEFGPPYATYQLAAVAELACCYFFRPTLSALLERRADVRQVLLSAAGLKHSARVLRANGIDIADFDEFSRSVTSLRGRWFQTDPAERRRETLALMFAAVKAEFSIVDSLRRGVSLLADSTSALARFSAGTVVAVLFDEVYFVAGWEVQRALAQTLALCRGSDRPRLVYPAEIAVLLAYYAAHGNVLRKFLQSQFLHVFDPAAITVTAAVEDRHRSVEEHYRFLHDAGLRWGGLPHWSFDPSADDRSGAPWMSTVRDVLFQDEPVGLNEFVQRLGTIEHLLASARAAVDAQQWAAAIPALDEALRLAPRNPAALYLRGVCCLATECPESLQLAATLLSQALESGHDPAWTRLFRSQVYLRLGDIDAAERDLDAPPCRNSSVPIVAETRNALLRQCGDARSHALIESAAADVNAGRHKEALISLEAALRISPQNARASYLQAFALQGQVLPQAAAAMAAYERALDLGFDPFWVYYNRAQLRLALGDLPEAKRDIDAARVLKPDEPNVATVAALIEERLSSAGWLVGSEEFPRP